MTTLKGARKKDDEAFVCFCFSRFLVKFCLLLPLLSSSWLGWLKANQFDQATQQRLLLTLHTTTSVAASKLAPNLDLNSSYLSLVSFDVTPLN